MLLFYMLSLFLLLGALIPPKRQNYYLLCSFTVLFIISAYRNISVGTDTKNYEGWFFQLEAGVEWIRYVIDPGWVFLNDIALSVGGDFRYVLILSTLLVLIPLYVVAKRYSENPMLTISLYYLLYFFFFSLNVTRQMIAVNIMLFAFVFIIKRKKVSFFCTVLIAFLFHKASVILLPLVFINSIKLNKLGFILCVFFAMLIGIFGVQYITFIAGVIGYERYLISNALGNLLGNITYLLILNSYFVFILLTINNVSIEFKIFFVFIVVFNLIIRFPFGDRLIFFFSVYQIIFYPYYFFCLSRVRTLSYNMKLSCYIVVILFCYVTFYMKFGAGEIIPYKNVLF